MLNILFKTVVLAQDFLKRKTSKVEITAEIRSDTADTVSDTDTVLDCSCLYFMIFSNSYQIRYGRFGIRLRFPFISSEIVEIKCFT